MAENFNSLALTFGKGIAHIQFTRPDLYNRFDEVLHGEFPRALANVLEKEGELAALLISSQGKHFSAGGDLEMMLRGNESLDLRKRLTREGLAIIEGLNALPFPVIAAVQGSAIGLGASVISCCDIVVAWADAKIADPHVVLGLVAGDGGIMGWSQSVGVMRAKRYLMTGDAITGREAHAMGMVSDVVERPDDALPAAQAIAHRISALPRGGVRGTKRSFARLSRDLYGAAFELSFAYEMDTLAGAELRDTVLSALSAKKA